MPRSAPPRTTSERRLSLGFLSFGLALLAGVGLRLWLVTLNTGITMDSPLYWRMATAIGQAQRADGPAHHGYPALIALVKPVVPGEILPGRVVSLAAAIALLVLVYLLARRTLSPAWSSLAVWLVALHPLVAVYGGVMMTESTVLALLYGALLLVESGRWLAGGLTLGAGYLVRPEAIALAPIAGLLSRGGARGLLWMLAGFSIVLLPYVGYLRWERGGWMVTPKTVLVRPAFTQPREGEWRISGRAQAAEEPKGFFERVRWAAPSVARNYGPGLLEHLGILRRSWPWPLVVLSLLGFAAWRRAMLAPVLLMAALPLLTVPQDPRFGLLAVPALAVFAACGGSSVCARLAARPRLLRVAVAATVAIAAFGVFWLWKGPEGMTAWFFDDGPMAQMREAGEWLRANGRPGARVMDRKAYVPFFAGMEHVQLPNDDYDTIIEFARREVDYLVIEEYVVASLRKQLSPLAHDPEFLAREKRLRLVFVTGTRPGNGVAVLEVVRDSSVAP
jgi:hypothetical protein